MWIIAIYERITGSSISWRISTVDPGFDVAYKATREEQLLFVSSDKRAAISPSGGFFSFPSLLGTFYGMLVLSANVHSWRINRARPHAFNNGRHAYNCSERRVLPGAVAPACLHCLRIRHVFAPRQTKALGTARKRDCHERNLSPTSRKLCYFFLCYFFRSDVCRNIFASRVTRILKGGTKHRRCLFSLNWNSWKYWLAVF